MTKWPHMGTLRPADATAARVIGRGPKALAPREDFHSVCSSTPLPMVNLTGPSLIGHVQGKLTVIGQAEQRSVAKVHARRWVCRCVCGYYVVRTNKALKNPRNHDDSCERCRRLIEAQKHTHWHATGRNLHEDDPRRQRDTLHLVGRKQA